MAIERLGRKAWGIVSAFEKVKCEQDWKKMGSAKNWHSKVDFEAWKRIDPGREGRDDHIFINRKAEDEMRGEMDREAQWLKVQQKLTDRAKGQKEEI